MTKEEFSRIAAFVVTGTLLACGMVLAVAGTVRLAKEILG